MGFHEMPPEYLRRLALLANEPVRDGRWDVGVGAEGRRRLAAAGDGALKMARPARLERATARFEVWCSIR
jgi:hypothetical protein